MPETAYASDPPWAEPHATPEELDQRIQRLEEAVRSLCDNSAVAERVRPLVVEELRKELQRLRQTGEAPRPNVEEDASGIGIVGVAPERNGVRLPFYWEVWSEVTLLYRMVRDPGFTMSWSAKIVPLFALLYVTLLPFFSGWLWGPPTIPVLSQLDDVIFAYIGFKVLGRELERYREHLRQLERYREHLARSA